MPAAVAIENERLYRDLETSNKAKSEFLSVMSHELKTPLHMILGYSALGRADALSRSDDDSQSWFGTIQAQAKNLLGMVNSIMAATRIESRTVEVHNQPTNVIQPD
jgi:signal transduction histidine kinase